MNKHFVSWLAVAFLVWWVIAEPRSATRLVHNIGKFLDTSMHGLAESTHSQPGWWVFAIVIIIVVVAIMVFMHFADERPTKPGKQENKK